MQSINQLYTANIKMARRDANETVKCSQRVYDSLKDKSSEYGVMCKRLLDLHIKAAAVYNDAPSEIDFK